MGNARNIADLSSDLSSDYTKLYENGNYTDTSIYVGKDPNSKIFLAHASILCARSSYFKHELTEITDEIPRSVVMVEDIEPDVFEILLR